MAVAVQGARLELRLLVVGADGQADAVELAAPADVLAGDVVDALGGAEALYVQRLGAIPRELPLREAGLRHGDRVFLSAPQAPEISIAERELVVVGGPASGRRFPLPPGEHVVGREGAIRVDDPALSGRH